MSPTWAISRRSPAWRGRFSAFGRIDCLVNNVGVAVQSRGDLLDVAPERYDRCRNVNLRGPFFLPHPARRATMSDGEGGGHFSPLAAYHEESDSFLVMDVARYKYPPFWVHADLPCQAMATPDPCQAATAATSSSTCRKRPEVRL